jgi:hypothetical protein
MILNFEANPYKTYTIGGIFGDNGEVFVHATQIANLIYHHTFTLPFFAMTWPEGICFLDGFGGLENRVVTVHELKLEPGTKRILKVCMETKDGVFTTLKSILENMILTGSILENHNDGDLRDEISRDPDKFILDQLLPCIKIGKAFVSGWMKLLGNDDDCSSVTIFDMINNDPDADHDSDKKTIRTQFLI